jgi:hypothetical protein
MNFVGVIRPHIDNVEILLIYFIMRPCAAEVVAEYV